MFKDSWKVLRGGNIDRAIAQMKKNLTDEWNPNYKMPACTSETLELGIAYFWLGDYRTALEVFSRYNEQFPNHGSDTYEMSGVARWYLGEFEQAVTQWQQGLHCEFADTAGLGITPPLLLLFASIFAPGTVSRREVEEILEQKAADRRSEDMPLVQFVLGEIQEQQLREKCDKSIFDRTDKRYAEDIEERHWRADFWLAVLEYDRRNDSRAKELFRKVGHLTWDDYDRNSDIFLTKLWTPEFFLARHEAGL